MTFDPAQWNSYLQLAITGGSLLGGVGALWWKISRSSVKTGLLLTTLKDQVEKLTAANVEITKAFSVVSTKLEEREKDIIKLEGVVDSSRKDMIHVVASLQQATSSLDAMWRTLRELFPNQVPARLSDRRL